MVKAKTTSTNIKKLTKTKAERKFDFKGFIKYYSSELFGRFDTDHIFLSAAGLAFSIIICIIPLVLIIIAVLGNILDSYNITNQISDLVDTAIPYKEYSETVKKILNSRINEVIEYKAAASWIGGLGLLFAASSLFASMRTILNNIYGIKTDVNIFLSKLWDFALVLMVIMMFFFVTVFVPILDLVRKAAFSWKSLQWLNSPIFEHVLFSFISFGVIFLLFIVLFVTLPRKKLNKRAILLSAFWSSFLWEAAKQVFGYYIYNFANYGKIYGTYALIVVVAFWIYYSSIIFIIGAEIGWLYYLRNYPELKPVKKIS